MKRLLIFLLFLFLAAPARAQGPVTIYFPLVLKESDTMPACDNHWKIIVPEATTNHVLNPSAEATGNYAAAGGAIVSRVTTFQKYGLHSYRITTSANGEGLTLTLSRLANTDYYVTLRVRGVLPFHWVLGVGTNYSTPLLLESIDNDWNLYGAFIPATEASGHTALHILQYGTGSGIFYADGIQIEPHAYPTTYVDGTQPGCGWNGAEHASTSTRSARSRAGGRVLDLAEDFSFYVTQHSGTGMGPQRLSVDDYALLPGGELNAVKAQSRVWTLTGDFIADSEKDLHLKRQALALVLDPSAYEAQPVLVRYTGSEVQKEISAVYEGGLEISGMPVHYGPYQRNATGSEWQEDYVFSERAAVRFLSPDPLWYEVGESATELDPNDSAVFRTVAGRLRETGQWDPLGPPSAAGTYNSVRALAEDEDYLYIGGDFTNWDGGGSPASDYIIRYDKQTGLYSSLGTGANGVVLALVLGPDGSLYAGGNFLQMGGVADTAYIARWTPTAGGGGAWSPLGIGMSNQVSGMAFGRDGLLYATGSFGNAGGVVVNGTASWNGASWSALGAGLNAVGNAVAGDRSSGLVYFGGTFSTAGGVAAARVAVWDPSNSSWAALGAGMNSTVNCLEIGAGGLLYAGGSFTTADGNTVNRIAVWNGTAWSGVGGGISAGAVLSIEVAPDGSLYVGGSFPGAGAGGVLTLDDGVARWNGVWTRLDLNLPGAPNIYVILAGPPDPVVLKSFDLWLGFDTTDSGYFDGAVTATNSGTVSAYPQVILERVEGKDATFQSVRSETLGLELLLNYDLLDGESLTIDLSPTKKSVTSGYWGPVPDAILSNSDFGSWRLDSGDNLVSCFVDYLIGLYPSEITIWLKWRDAFLSLD